MGKVILDLAMSLDGFISGPNGEDQGLHDYFFSPSGNTAEVIEEGFRTTGAIVMGRRAYDIGDAQDGFADNPYQVPTFVITHHVPETVAKGAESFVFVTDGIESAIKQAIAAAGDRDVAVGGGANIAQQCLQLGLLDEIQLHVAPRLFGDGLRLFDQPGGAPIELESTRVIDAPDAIHLQYRVVK
jgi:dihydrofolate reductase